MKKIFDDLMLSFVFMQPRPTRVVRGSTHSLSKTGKSDPRATEGRLLSFISTVHVWTHGRDVLCSVHTCMPHEGAYI